MLELGVFSEMKRAVKKLLAGFMAVWLSGVIFLLCCHSQSMAAMDSCPLVRLGAHCDKAEKAKETEKVQTPITGSGFDCCAFIPAFFHKTRTFDSYHQVALVAPAAAVIKPLVVTVTQNFPNIYTSRSVILPKNDTFLKNRSFRT